MKTFELLSEFNALAEIAEEIEFDEETGEIIDRSQLIKDLFEEVVGEAGVKLEQIEYIKKDLSAGVNALKEEEARLAKRRKGIEKNIERLKELQIMVLDQSDGKVKTDKFTFFERKSEAVEINPFVDAKDMADKYRTVKYSFNKTELKKAIKGGQKIAGVELVINKSVGVK